MKLLRYGPAGKEKPGMLDAEGKIRDLSAHCGDLAGEAVSLEALDKLRSIDRASLPLVAGDPRIGSCLASVPNFHCVGLNYVKHAQESGLPIPEEPVLFSKATSAIWGPYDRVTIPKGSQKTDWEVELGVIIGKRAEHVAEDDALSYVAGYCTINDVSERAYQIERGGQWVKGKSAPTFGPIGPWLVTADELPDPQGMRLWLSLNGMVVQDSSTSDMIFSVAKIVSYMSEFMALLPGDIISTGTPSGVGLGMKPPLYLKPGDVMELEVEGLGRQRQEAVAYSD